MGQAAYELAGSTLAIRGELLFPVDAEFFTCANALVKDAKRRGVMSPCVDLRKVPYMASQYIGVLAAMAGEIASKEGRLTVNAKGQVAKVLVECGLNHVLTLVIE